MLLMRTTPLLTGLFVTTLLAWPVATLAVTTPAELASTLNEHRSVLGPDDEKAWAVLSGPLQQLGPMPDGVAVSYEQLWPGMDGWDEAAAWSASQSGLAEAVAEASDRIKFGMPYGREAVSEDEIAAGLLVDLGEDDQIIKPEFVYLERFERLLQWIVVESNRQIEAGQVEDGIELLMDGIFLMRLMADRDFLDEKSWAMERLIGLLEVLRDVMYRNQDQMSAELLRRISLTDMPAVRPDRARLFIPEHDRLVCRAFLQNAFDETAGGDAERFPRVYTEIQANAEPLARFGARRRWESLRDGHDALNSSLDRLDQVYDDWWRRWRVNPSSDMGQMILAKLSQFEVMNQARFAAMLVAIQDMQRLFDLRDDLVWEVNATASAAALASYVQNRDTYPSAMRLLYGITGSKEYDKDIHDLDRRGFVYRVPKVRKSVDIGRTRVWLEPGIGLLYSVGRDGIDGLAARHLDVESGGDLLIWPPAHTLVREHEQESP